MYTSISSHYKFIFLFIVIINEISYAQLNPKNLVQFNEKDGVPEIEIDEILQDHLGYIWIPSGAGLFRYNGYEFKRFLVNPNDSTSIKSSAIRCLGEDSKGNIWIGSVGRIEVYNPDKKIFKHYENGVLNEYSLPVRINGIAEGSDGRIYFGVFDANLRETLNSSIEIKNCLLYYDGKDDRIHKFKTPDSLVIKSVFSLRTDSNKNVWVLSRNGLFKIDKNNNITKISGLDEKIIKSWGLYHDFVIDSKGIFWITGYNSKLYSFDPRTGKINSYSLNGLFKNFDNKLSTYCIAIDKSDNLWLGTQQGLVFYDQKTRKYKIFKKESERHIERTVIWGLNFDSFGSLWIGTSTSGLLKYDQRSSFESYGYNKDDNNSLTSGSADNIIKGRKGKIWITTDDIPETYDGISEFDPKTRLIKRWFIHKILPGIYGIQSIYQISENEFYICTEIGIYLFNSKNNSIKKIILNGLPKDTYIHYFYKDSKGNFWLCTSHGIYGRRKGSKRFKGYNLDVIHGAASVVESRYHGLWFITGDGLFYYNYKYNTFKRCGFNNKKGYVFPTQEIHSLYEDQDGIVWVGCYGGLCKYNPETGKIKTYTINDGLPSMSVEGIISDEKNNTLWLSTSNGLSRFDKQSEKFTNFSTDDGIQSPFFNWDSYSKTSGGLFVFGNTKGITVFNPAQITKNSIPPKVFLTDLKLSDKSVLPGKSSILKKPIYETDEINLGYNNNNITIDYIALHYLDPLKNQYAYILENYDKNWRHVGTQRTAYYSNLPPGEYVFRVKASNNHGLWNEKGASLRIIIHPPFWMRWWFILLSVLVVCGAIILFLYSRFKRLKEEKQRKSDFSRLLIELQEKERKRIASELHDGLGQNLLIIKNLAYLGNMENHQDPKQYLDDISNIAGRSVAEVREIAHNLRPHLLDKLGLSKSLRNMIHQSGESSAISLSENICPLENLFSPEEEMNIYRIVQEGINNIIKHSDASEAFVSVERKDDLLSISIKDNGKGFSMKRNRVSPPSQSGEYGLMTMYERVQMLHGKFIVFSEPGKGTELKAEIPIISEPK